MQKQRENPPLGPFRATRLWDEAIRLFTQGMPRKRHRVHMRVYEDSFTGSEAIKWFYQALEMNPHFSAVITQEKTHQLLNKFYDEGVFIKVKDSVKSAGDHFKLQGLYQMNQTKPQHTARTPLSTKYLSNYNQRSENWIRRSLHKEPLGEFVDACLVKQLSEKDSNPNKFSVKTSSVNNDSLGRAPFQNPQACLTHDKQCLCESQRPGRVMQHPLQQRKLYEQKQALSPTHLDNVWREVFSNRLQALLQDLDVCGLLWPCAVIRCQWLEHNCSLEESSGPQFPPWVKASSNRLLQALTDRNLNRSVLNLDIEADVSAMEAYFGNLQSPLIPGDLCAVFLRVFLHLEMAASPSVEDNDDESVDNDCASVVSDSSTNIRHFEEHHPSLPPNTCFETAFTSASPVTRIVPQCSFDTLHLRPASACTLTKRNMSAPKLLEACSKYDEEKPKIRKSALSQSTVTGLNDNIKYSTLGGTGWESKSKLKSDSIGGSLHRNVASKTFQECRSPGNGEGHHNCGQLKVIDKTPPNYRSGTALRRPLERHGRSHSGGYVNLGLQDSFEGQDIKNAELDLDAAMDSLNKLILCSQPSGSLSSSKDFRHHARSTSLSESQDQEGLSETGVWKNQSCSSQKMRSSSIPPYCSAVLSSTSSPKSNFSLSYTPTSYTNSCLSLTAGCEWGWDWGSDAEITGVAVFRLLTLLLPPQSRAQLKLLLKFMGLLPYQCPYTTIKVLDMFSSCIVPCGNEDVTARFLGFMVRHHLEIFVPPEDLISDVENYKNNKMKSKERAAVTFCERVSLLQFEEQKLTTSQKALAELLDQIIEDEKISLKEKTKKLKMFKDAYPHIYSMKFPDAKNVPHKSRHRSILQLARLRSLRV